MSSSLNNNKRIAKNTGLLYIRMLVLMFISLYTSRIVLAQLGVVDFGINNVVAGFVSMLSFFTSSLSNVVQRFLNISLGREDLKQVTCVFRQSLTIMVLVSIVIIIAGETVGLWFVCNKLVIPPDRMYAAIWTYQFAMVSVVCSIIQVVFVGVIVAHERMGAYAYLGLFEAFAKLAIAYLLVISDSDRLILYSFLNAFVSIMTTLFFMWYTFKNFQECKVSLYWDGHLLGEMSRFVGVNIFGCFAYAIGVQGTTIILNMFFGPTVNAARGIAVQVSSAIMRFSESIMTAIKPQIIKSYATDDIQYMIFLIEKSSKYAFFLCALISIPLILECHTMLRLWLGQVPEHSVNFTRIVICEMLISILNTPLWLAANATGKIAPNQIYGRTFTLLGLPISYIILLFYKEPIIPMIILFLCNVGYWFYCVYDMHRQINLSIFKYTSNVVIPSFVLFVVTIGVGAVIKNIIMIGNILNFFMVCISTVIIGLFMIYILTPKRERETVITLIKDKIKHN